MGTNEKIEYTEKLLVKFLKDLIVFDKGCKSAIRFVKNVIENRSSEEEKASGILHEQNQNRK